MSAASESLSIFFCSINTPLYLSSSLSNSDASSGSTSSYIKKEQKDAKETKLIDDVET
jgi:hypothetical protein